MATITFTFIIKMLRYGNYHQPGHSAHPAKKPRLYQEEEPRSQARKTIMMVIMMVMPTMVVVMVLISR